MGASDTARKGEQLWRLKKIVFAEGSVSFSALKGWKNRLKIKTTNKQKKTTTKPVIRKALCYVQYTGRLGGEEKYKI